MKESCNNAWDDDVIVLSNKTNTHGIINTETDWFSLYDDPNEVLVSLKYLNYVVDTAERIEDGSNVLLIAENDKPVVIIPKGQPGYGYAVAPRVRKNDMAKTVLDTMREGGEE